MNLLHILLLCFLGGVQTHGEHVRDLEISEGATVGTRVGFIGDGLSGDSGPPYLIVPVPGSAVDSDLLIEQTTGEIRTKVPLDRETRSSYSLVAIPLSGENVRVVVRVLDENDNAPSFPTPVMSIEFPENTPRDVKRTLNPARDYDLGIYNTQRYNIVSGNVNNAFRLSSHRERDGVLYLDLQINGFLDRETTAAYSLLIESLDGGSPPLRGSMTVNITIQDVNDNQPIFNQSRYFATIPENATVGTSVLQVFATDTDASDNGQVVYSVNRRQSDKEGMFRIDASTGLIAVNRPLDFETKEVHELVVVARDHGIQPLETTAFVSIRVTDVNDNQPTINVIFLSDDATPKISESAKAGEFVARISVNDPDSKTEYSNVNVTLQGGDGRFGLATRDNIIYLVIVSLPLDREIQPNYTLSVIATDTGSPPLHASRTFHLQVTDINDNAPEFERPIYYANVLEVADPGTSVFQIHAIDRDEGNNSALAYSILETPETHSTWFKIDFRSGLITTKSHIDCETDPVPQLTVIAMDNGKPPLSSSATVLVTIHDVNDNEPIFDQSFYNVSVVESEPAGRCILKVSATDPDCGVNAMVNYTLGDGFGKVRDFQVRSASGEVCISGVLDYETRSVYEFPVVATDRGGLSTTAMVKIQLTDVNDNHPTFYPREYNVSLREADATASSSAPVVVVVATDPDSSRFGQISYRIVAGNDAGLFRVDRNTGEIFVTRPSLLSTRTSPYHRLNISAVDGGGLRATQDAEVFLSVTNSAQRPPIFERPRYTFTVKEDVQLGSHIGAVKATSNDGVVNVSPVRYSIYSGDPDGYFAIDPVTGAIRTATRLDHEDHQSILLNVQAMSGNPAAYGHTQVNIGIDDVNDNAPEFESMTVRISVPENVELGIPLYAAHARDRDSGRNGVVRYRLAGKGTSPSSGRLFSIDPRLGHLTLARHLDYETAQRHTLVVLATDTGDTPLSSNLTILVEVQDVNDNPPVFERPEYIVNVLESLAVNSQVVQVTAVDLDTGNNARLTYRLISSSGGNKTAQWKTNDEEKEIFGVFPNSGWLYLRQPLDRETKDRYSLIVGATDNGTPAGSATAKIVVTVMDANDNNPTFKRESYQFTVEENRPRGTVVGIVAAHDADLDLNAVLRYSLIPSNTSFQVNSLTGEISTLGPLDREAKTSYELVAEARDQGTPTRSGRVQVRIQISDVNDNSPELIDPQEDVISVREEQPANTEVVRVRAIDLDEGANATVTYSILKGKDTDGYGVFTVDPVSGVIRTRTVLDHEDKAIYRLAVAATDGGKPARQTVRTLRVEVLDLNDNRPTFTSSSLVFKVKENVKVGHVVGMVPTSDSSDASNNLISGRHNSHITYTLSSLTVATNQRQSNDVVNTIAFDIDRTTGSLVVAGELDREIQAEYRLEVRALDTSATNNPQSSAVSVRVNIIDVNDNAPIWSEDPVIISIPEDTPVGSSVWNFTATDSDAGPNGEIRYSLVKQWPNDTNTSTFTIDPLTGTMILHTALDFEVQPEYTLIIRATDQASNISERLFTSITARVVVSDTNDNLPVFVSPSIANIVISDSLSVGVTICNVLAVDRDSGDNGRVSYVFGSGNERGLFAISYDTGVLSLAKSLIDGNGVKSGGETGRRFMLNITASDHGSPFPKYAVKMFVLTVHGTNETPPRFLNSAYHANISEGSSIGTYVVKVSARSAKPEQGSNLTYSIPSGICDDRFTIDNYSGVISLLNVLDREAVEQYQLPVYATDLGPNGPQFDVTTVTVRVLDVNDHSPEFKQSSCYPIAVPENSDLAVIHTIVAADQDSVANGEITYTITAGNLGQKFSIDLHSGELTARPLDRETLSRYHLVITAQDRGAPTQRQGTCNITVIVEDQNDNDPQFAQARYAASIPENSPVATSVLMVQATDADLAVNAKITYSLANESQWLFRIDNKSGIIYTAGLFDHERQNSYHFQVVATDGGRYDARSQKVPIHISIADVNDNKPIFTQFPFTAEVPAYTQPGHNLVRVTATDADEGTNADVVFSFLNEPPNNKFRLNPNTGVVTAASSLAMESGRLFHLEVLARDKGNPPQSATGLVEIKVGASPDGAPFLRFQNTTYSVELMENTPVGKDIIQVSAVRTDGRRQHIVYSFGSGNEDNTFELDSVTGLLRVKDNKLLDAERWGSMRLMLAARADALTPSAAPLYGYCEVRITLLDQNDNPPQFTQQQYSANVWEGNNKGTFVMQVSAKDADQSSNSRVLYHIVDGNHDNAFVIEPPFSGLVKTNIVLDREIRDLYRLTVIATDEGVPQMTGTTTLRVNIVDVNDNQPTFPQHSIISVPEDTEVGTILTSVTANDVDTNPALTYNFSEDETGDEEDDANRFFSIDRFSGKVTLIRRLDFETRQGYRLRVTASDTAHTAHTVLTIRVTDVNDNAPIFQQVSYEAVLHDGSSSVLALMTVNATDVDSGNNAKVRYSLVSPEKGFHIDQTTGTLYANRSGIATYLLTDRRQDIHLAVLATDMGIPVLSSVAAIRVIVSDVSNSRPKFLQDEYRIHIKEDASSGTTIMKIVTPDVSLGEDHNVIFAIIDGNTDETFQIMSPSGDLILLRQLDRETECSYQLRVVSGRRGSVLSNSSAVLVHLTVDDANDNAPLFLESAGYYASVSESLPVGHSILQVFATDADLPGSQNSEIIYDITSGNDRELFALDPQTGILSVAKVLDYDVKVNQYLLVVRASDSALEGPLSSVVSVRIALEDKNDNTPRFPVGEYLEFVGENESVGTSVFAARATDLDKGIFGKLNYSIVPTTGYSESEEPWKLFNIDPLSGLVTTNSIFDYEVRNHYSFSVKASDSGGRMANVKVRIEIESRDEFHPQFTERTYRFNLATWSSRGQVPVGQVVGHVIATDRDKGPDGRVVYQLTTQHPYFKVNRTTGAVMVKKKMDNSGNALDIGRDVSLVVTASSGRQGSLTNMSVVEIIIDPLTDRGKNLASSSPESGNSTVTAASGGLADWALGLLIALILLVLAFATVFLFLHMRNRRHKKVNKPALNSAVGSNDGFVDPSAFDTIPIRGGGGVQGPTSQFGPPKYDEIPPYVGGPVVHRNNNSTSSNSGAATTSELSGSEQSGSSGRGSAEDGDDVEDEEIRMINEGPLQRDSGIIRQGDIDDDNLSDVSVHNTQEYLARLGIVDNSTNITAASSSRRCSDTLGASGSKETLMHQGAMDGLHMFDEEGGGEADITNLIYAKLNDVGSDRGSSTETGGVASNSSLGAAVDHVMVLGGFADVATHQPSMTGSLSSIVHSEEELTGSYNWDYLLDWGPQYQPLAHVFSEIARLKDDTVSVQSASSSSSGKAKAVPQVIKTVIPPPLLTSVAPRLIAAPVLSSRHSTSHHTSTPMHQQPSTQVPTHHQLLMPRSPISHDASGTGFSTSAAMSPSFSPSLSPLATRSPSISPLVTPGVSLPRRVASQQSQRTALAETELRI